jgi:hypothetical protein
VTSKCDYGLAIGKLRCALGIVNNLRVARTGDSSLFGTDVIIAPLCCPSRRIAFAHFPFLFTFLSLTPGAPQIDASEIAFIHFGKYAASHC